MHFPVDYKNIQNIIRNNQEKSKISFLVTQTITEAIAAVVENRLKVLQKLK